MPVTAKFSQQFYDKFGHDAVDELVNFLNRIDSGYRSELRELNESNFVRFDAKLEQRVAELRGEMRAQFAAIETRLLRWMLAFWATTMLAVVGFAIRLG